MLIACCLTKHFRFSIPRWLLATSKGWQGTQLFYCVQTFMKLWCSLNWTFSAAFLMKKALGPFVPPLRTELLLLLYLRNTAVACTISAKLMEPTWQVTRNQNGINEGQMTHRMSSWKSRHRSFHGPRSSILTTKRNQLGAFKILICPRCFKIAHTHPSPVMLCFLNVSMLPLSNGNIKAVWQQSKQYRTQASKGWPLNMGVAISMKHKSVIRCFAFSINGSCIKFHKMWCVKASLL